MQKLVAMRAAKFGADPNVLFFGRQWDSFGKKDIVFLQSLDTSHYTNPHTNLITGEVFNPESGKTIRIWMDLGTFKHLVAQRALKIYNEELTLFKLQVNTFNLTMIKVIAAFCENNVRDNHIEGESHGVYIPRMNVKSVEKILKLRAKELLGDQLILVKGFKPKNESTTDRPDPGK